MTPDELKALRPADNTVDAIKKSLAEIERRKQAAEARRTAKATEEQELLLTATPRQIAAFNAEIAELDLTIRQLAALLADVQPELAPAQRREELATLAAEHSAAANMADRLRAFAFDRYPAIAAEMMAAAELERQYGIAARHCRNWAQGLGLSPDERAVLPTLGEAFHTTNREGGLAAGLSLPALLPIDAAQEQPVEYWIPALPGQPGGRRTISSAQLAARRAPPNVPMARRMTPEEIEAAGHNRRNVLGGMPSRRPSTVPDWNAA